MLTRIGSCTAIFDALIVVTARYRTWARASRRKTIWFTYIIITKLKKGGIIKQSYLFPNRKIHELDWMQQCAFP